jgi:N-methylhydantoinase A
VSPTVLVPGTGDPAAARTGYSRIYVDGGWQDAARYDRALLRAGDVIDGPAIVTEMDSTTLILPGHAATADPCGSLLIRPAKES